MAKTSCGSDDDDATLPEPSFPQWFSAFLADRAVRKPSPDTAKAYQEGLMSEGDVGHRDYGGRMFVVGRDDETIVSRGENAYPIDAEKALSPHHDVAEASVIYSSRSSC